MAQTERAAIYRALKGAGVEFTKHYREYSVEELSALAAQHGVQVEPPARTERDLPAPRGPEDEGGSIRDELRQLSQTVNQLVQLQLAQVKEPAQAPVKQRGAREPEPEQARGYMRDTAPTVGGLDVNEHAGITSNSHGKDEVLYVDEHGNQWFQREVRKPAYPKPRGRRVLRYSDPGVKQETIKVGDYEETFEVAGDPQNSRPAEIKVTLPSYQTGIYKAPNLPFKVHTYNGARGFDLEDVQRFYGGADLVPDTVKKVYVSTDLCYDITTTIRAIKDEARELALTKGRML